MIRCNLAKSENQAEILHLVEYQVTHSVLCFTQGGEIEPNPPIGSVIFLDLGEVFDQMYLQWPF